MLDNNINAGSKSNNIDLVSNNFTEIEEKHAKTQKSENISTEKTQNTVTFQTTNQEKKNLILSKRSKSNVNELHLMLHNKSQNSDSDCSNLTAKFEVNSK